MKPKPIFTLFLLFACTIGPIAAVFAYEAYRNKDLTADIIARAPERGNFTPQVVKVTAGEKVKLRIRNIDTVMHGFTIPALKIDIGELKAGHSVTIEFTPEEPGTFDYYCTVWCSEFHMQMRGLIEVAAK